MSFKGMMSNLSSCSSGSCPRCTCSPVLLASKGILKARIVAMQADGIRDTFYYFSYVHAKQLFLWERIKSSCCLLQTMCGFLILANPGWIEKTVWEKESLPSCGASFIWESENFRKQKAILLQLQLCGKSQKPLRIKWRTVVKSEQNTMCWKEDARSRTASCGRWLWAGMDP